MEMNIWSNPLSLWFSLFSAIKFPHIMYSAAESIGALPWFRSSKWTSARGNWREEWTVGIPIFQVFCSKESETWCVRMWRPWPGGCHWNMYMCTKDEITASSHTHVNRKRNPFRSHYLKYFPGLADDITYCTSSSPFTFSRRYHLVVWRALGCPHPMFLMCTSLELGWL